jgi:hypothetical protein
LSRVELTRRIGMDREDLFGLVVEPVRWPGFYNNMVSVGESARFAQPGDRVGFEYRVLGRVVTGEARLVEIYPPARVGLEARIPGVLTSRQRWEFVPDGQATLVSVRLETDEVSDWFGVPVDRYVVARSLHADLARTLDNLSDLVASGLV